MATTFAPAEELWIAERKTAERKRLRWIVVGTVIAALYPFADSALGINRMGAWIPILAYVLLAMGLNIVVGYAGLLDLGYVAFFVIGAYTNAFITSPNSVFVQHGIIPGFLQSFWPAMALSWVMAAIFGVLLGAPTLRLRGDYLAIVTLGFGEIVPNFFTNAAGVTNGPQGIGQIAQPGAIPLPGGHRISFGTTDQHNWYWLILCMILFSVFLITRLYDSRLGRAWQAVREDEIAAASMGVNLVATKLWAFALGASFSGFAGSIYAGYVRVVYPDQFQFSVSVIILSMVILGGIGNVYGAIAGALIIGSFDRILADAINVPLHKLGDITTLGPLQTHDVNTDRFLIFGLALVLTMLFRPGGLFPSERRRAEMEPESADITEAERESLYDVEQEAEART
jgi:branched-chain amino acid transport system permease protein